MEKISINPSKVRAYGNIITPKTSTDFSVYGEDYKIVESTDTVYGAETGVFELRNKYDVSFNSATYTTSSSNVNVQVSVLQGTTPVASGTVYVTGCGGSGSGNIGYDVQTGTWLANVAVTGITSSGTLTANYKGATATATLTYSPVAYTLQFSRDTYTPGMFDEVTVYVTLKDNGVAMSGETITFTYYNGFSTETATATTNSNGVASLYLEGIIGTVTATYQGVTATCTIESGGGII